jgi:uncharacterized protein
VTAQQRRSKRRWLRWGFALLLLALAILGKGYWNAVSEPIIRTASISAKDWTVGEPSLKLLLISDIHVAGPDMPPSRLERLVGEFNALKPDLILIAGDLVSEKRIAAKLYSPAEVIAPLGGLQAPLGVIVTPGNHDHWFDMAALIAEMEKRGITVLQNGAVLRGPLIIGGIDDDYTRRADIMRTYDAMAKLQPSPRILLTHSPDVAARLPAPVAAVFAGHTHCGQIAFPIVGALTYVSAYGGRFACGDILDQGQRIFVGAGLGTSVMPLRYGAMPDAWLVTIGP